MSKFHINKNGSIGKCNATNGKCPFGGETGMENHFDNISDAKKHYEEKMKYRNIPKATSKKFKDNTRVKDFNPNNPPMGDSDVKKAQILEKSRSEDYIRKNFNSDYIFLKALANNPVTPPEVLEKAYNEGKDKNLKRKLMEHNNFPVGAMTIDEFSKTLNNDNKYERFKSNDITDEHVKRMMINDGDINSEKYTPEYKAPLKMFKNPKNMVTGDFIKEFIGKRNISRIEYELYIKPNVGIKI